VDTEIIGRAIAYRLAEAGADLIFVDIHRKNLEIVDEALAAHIFETNLNSVICLCR
jgi:NAD(P)-dependent dehydrogenase (short-subunit alcohol dehydrogenase family)